MPKPTYRQGRSAVTNGSVTLPGVDGRSAWVRRLKDLIALHLVDLGGGDRASEAEKSIIRRASAMTVELERLELKFAQASLANQEPNLIDIDLYFRGANSLRRLLESIGLERRPRDVTPSVRDYVEHIEAAE